MDVGTLLGAARPLIPVLAVAIAHWGFGTEAQNTVIIGAIFTALATIWGAFANTQTAKVASINATDNGLRVVNEKAAVNAGIAPASAPLK